jgi:hypothetical protein
VRQFAWEIISIRRAAASRNTASPHEGSRTESLADRIAQSARNLAIGCGVKNAPRSFSLVIKATFTFPQASRFSVNCAAQRIGIIVHDLFRLASIDNIPAVCYIFLIPLSEGVFRKTAEGGAGCGACGRDLSSRTRAASGAPPGVTTDPCQELADDPGQSPGRKARPDAGDAKRRLSQNAAVKRRKARRPA